MKKLSKTIKLVIVLSAFAVVFLALAIGAAFASPYRAKDAINSIGTVTFTAESKQKIDDAITYYNDIGKNTLGESALVGTAYKEANKDEELEKTLEEAKRTYVNLAIKNAIVSENRKYAESYTTEDLTAIFSSTRAVIDDYFPGSTDFENYDEFALYEKNYVTESTSNDKDTDNSSTEEVEVCT
jgi:hypothetical protein